MRLQLRLSTILFALTIIAVCAAWFHDHQRLVFEKHRAMAEREESLARLHREKAEAQRQARITERNLMLARGDAELAEKLSHDLADRLVQALRVAESADKSVPE